MSFQLSKLSTSIKCAIAVGLLSVPLSGQAMTNEEADLNGDGQVNFLDFYAVITRLGAERGMPTYRASLDINNDGLISIQDYFALFGNYGQGATTSNTSFSGQVVDNQSPPNPIKGVRVEVENSGADGCTDEFGRFMIPLTESDFGENLVTFDGSQSNGCGLTDATPGTLSGEYPTIPHKPVFINGGTNNEFRLMSLPERDLLGAVEVAGNADDNGGNNFTLTQEVVVDNAGVELEFTDGCTIQFPDGETPRLSITEVDPGLLPVAPPPGQGSSLFVTFQPGGSQVADCDSVVVLFDNSDMMANAVDPDSADQPGLRGVVDGAFQELVKVFAGDLVGDSFVNASPGDNSAPLLRGEIPVPFDFAWYAVTVPANPCPLTIVTGQVLLNNPAMDPVENARVAIGGVGSVFTNANGQYSFVNVPAGPNGPLCNTNPFSIAATASKDLDSSGFITFDELGGSGAIPSVPGGITDMGIIKLGLTGIVQGSVLKLNSIDPFVTIPLSATEMLLNPVAQGAPNIMGQSNITGAYRLENVPTGGFVVSAEFDGVLPLPGGGTANKTFSGVDSGFVTFEGEVVAKDFKFLGHGEINMTVKDSGDIPLSNINVQLFAFGGDFNGFQAGSQFCFLNTDDDGNANFNQDSCGATIPMGPCEMTIFDDFGGEFGFFNELFIGPEDGCFINEHGQVLVFDEVFEPQGFPGDIVSTGFNISFHRPLGGNPNGDDDIPTFEVLVEFTEPFDSFDTFVELHLDLDQDQGTGFNSNLALTAGEGPIVAQNVISNNVGADIRIICNDDLIFGSFGLGFEQCMGVDEFGNAVPGLEQVSFTEVAGGPFESLGNMVLLVPRQPIIDFANSMAGGPFGEELWDIVLEVGVDAFGYGGDGYGGIVFDMVPNTEFGEDPFEVDPGSFNSIDDEIGDFFFDQLFLD